MAKILSQFRSKEHQEKITLFYLERIMEQVESSYLALAKNTLERYRLEFSLLLKPNHLSRLEELTRTDNHWSSEIEQKLWERLRNAWEFSEFKTVHDCAHEILLHHEGRNNGITSFVEQVQEILAENNCHYLEPDQIAINTFVNSAISFIVEKRKASSQPNKNLQGNPGFYLEDAAGFRYRCFVKQVDHVHVGDKLKLKITNIPGLAFATQNSQEPILYLEPRVAPGDVIEIELGNLSHTENSFTFRLHSYDGFLWFKRRGVNKSVFNKGSLQPGDRVVARVLYTTEEEKRANSGNINRLGIIKAIPLRKADSAVNPEENLQSDVAKVLN